MTHSMNLAVDGHVVLFLQPKEKLTRSYIDYINVREAFKGMMTTFEDTFKERNCPTDFSLETVLEFYGAFNDMLMLVYDKEIKHYIPHDDEWILRKLEEYGSQQQRGNRARGQPIDEDDF